MVSEMYPVNPGIRLHYDEYQMECCCCGQWTDIYCGPEEIDPDDWNYEHYCGGSPRCCP